MTHWFILAKSGTSNRSLNLRLKDIIRSQHFFRQLFALYAVPLERLDDLTFKVKKLRGRYATSNAKEIWLNEKLFDDDRFFDERVHFVVHELVHWLTRQREKECYFADPEEAESFAFSMCFEILRGKNKDEVRKAFLPIIQAHFTDKTDAARLFNKLHEKARILSFELNAD